MKTVLLRIGDISDDGKVTIIDEDRLCYIVKNESKGASGLRTISKSLLSEFIDYVRTNPQTKADEARMALCGQTCNDKFEYEL